MDFVNGDIVVFKADAAKRVFRVLYLEEDRVRISYALKNEPNTASPSELSYPHLLTLAEPIMQFFRFGHLPAELQIFSRPFWELANMIVVEYPRNPERTVALRKLLEAKDAAVRSTLYQS
jgi:hypothetical protein